MLQKWLLKVTVLTFGLALAQGRFLTKRSDTCYIDLYQQSNLLGDEIQVEYKRSNIRKIDVLSLEVTGDPAYCCFKVFR